MYIDKANPCVCLSSTLFIMLNSFALCSSLKQLNLSVSLKVNEIKIVNKKHFLILVDLILESTIFCVVYPRIQLLFYTITQWTVV